MKYKLTLLFFLLAFCSCNQTKKSLDGFDMTKFCDDYIILKFPSNKTCYVFISRDGKDSKRFVIFKNYNYKDSGYGYVYNDYIDGEAAIKHGVFSSAGAAIKEAEKQYAKGHLTADLDHVIPNGGNEWLHFGERMFTLCPEN